MKTIKVNIDSIFKIRLFNDKALKYPGKHLDLISGRYIVDAKSIMGIFSLDVSKPITLEYEEEYESFINKEFGILTVQD
jgi:hypothetical protein